MGVVMATDVGTADAATITDGTEAAVTTNGTTAGRAFATFAFVIPLTTNEWPQYKWSRRYGAAGSVIKEG